MAIQPDGRIVTPNARYLASEPEIGSLALSGFPTTTTAGQAQTITVTALNANGTVNTGYTGTVTFSSSDSQAGLPSNFTLPAATMASPPSPSRSTQPAASPSWPPMGPSPGPKAASR